MPETLYDRIGQTYITTRRPDPRIATAVGGACGEGATIVKIGAGAGAYEPTTHPVVGVEPSWRMIRQRARGTPPVVRAVA